MWQLKVALISWATATATVVLPMPPGPTIVTNLCSVSFIWIAARASLRPSIRIKRAGSRDLKPSPRSRLPARLMRMLGRRDALAAIQMKLTEQRFVTIVGPGGIGKTTVAVAVAHEMSATFNGHIHFVDLVALGADSLVVPAMATALGVSVQTNNVVPASIDRLQERPALIIFDCCEHLIDGASAVAEELTRRVPTLHLLASSREA